MGGLLRDGRVILQYVVLHLDCCILAIFGSSPFVDYKYLIEVIL